jgi:hypothetical protein
MIATASNNRFRILKRTGDLFEEVENLNLSFSPSIDDKIFVSPDDKFIAVANGRRFKIIKREGDVFSQIFETSSTPNVGVEYKYLF